MKHVLDTGAVDEQLIVVTSIWKLVANNYKTKHSIKSSAIPQKCLLLKRSLSDRNDDVDDVTDELYTRWQL